MGAAKKGMVFGVTATRVHVTLDQLNHIVDYLKIPKVQGDRILKGGGGLLIMVASGGASDTGTGRKPKGRRGRRSSRS
jgi:hypothetical protein